MDVERALVSKIIASGQLEQAISRGIKEELFRDDEARDLYGWLLNHQRRYRTPPSLAVVREEKPRWEFLHLEDSIEYLLDRFVAVSKRRFAQEMVVELAQACDDPERSENIDLEFLEVSRRLATLVPSTEISWFKGGMAGRIDEYEREERDGKTPGIPFGFPFLDDLTGGLQRHEYATVAAFSGVGKSTFMIAAAFNFFMQDYRPLYVSLEMERKQLHRKWDAMASKLDYIKMKQLRLSATQIQQWRKTRDEISQRTGDIAVIDSIRGCTPDTIYAEAVRHKPDVILLDYVSLMRSARASRNTSLWQQMTEITQDLKQVARTLKVPIVAAAQTNRSGMKEGADLDNLAYSQSIVQDSDIVIALHSDEELRSKREMEIHLRKNRDGPLGQFLARWDHENLAYRDKDAGDKFFRPHPPAPVPEPEPQRPARPRPGHRPAFA